jgi:hypothetical protein
LTSVVKVPQKEDEKWERNAESQVAGWSLFKSENVDAEPTPDNLTNEEERKKKQRKKKKLAWKNDGLTDEHEPPSSPEHSPPQWTEDEKKLLVSLADINVEWPKIAERIAEKIGQPPRKNNACCRKYRKLSRVNKKTVRMDHTPAESEILTLAGLTFEVTETPKQREEPLEKNETSW